MRGAGAVALSALAGAAGLATGADLGDALNERLPFASPVLGGIALALVVGPPFIAVAFAAWRGSPRTGQLSFVAGAILVAWIVVELAFIRSELPSPSPRRGRRRVHDHRAGSERRTRSPSPMES